MSKRTQFIVKFEFTCGSLCTAIVLVGIDVELTDKARWTGVDGIWEAISDAIGIWVNIGPLRCRTNT